MLQTSGETEFLIAQVWAYNTRPQEPTSTLTIVKVEADERQGTIVHIHVQGLRMKNPHSEDGFTTVISHLPCSEEVVRESVTHLLYEGVPRPEFEEGYREWRAAFDAGQAGIWGIPVARMIEAMEIVLNQLPEQAIETKEKGRQP